LAKETTSKSSGFTAEERAAMKERAKELKAQSGRGKDKGAADLADVQAKIAEMPAEDRALAERIHAIVTETAPELAPRTWYGMPAYAKDGKVICFFTAASKFKERYSTFGFQPAANLDDGSMWPTSFALAKLTKADEKRIAEMVKKAVS
jgi:uncharacterized protein YdhG (YjbR/CyaY superfamily)